MRILFELLRARPINDSVDIESLERQAGIILPPIYKLFAQSFYLGEKHIYREQYYNELYKDYFDCSAYVYTSNENIGFSHFGNIEKCFEIWNSKSLGDMDYELGIFPIGAGNFGGIGVGLKNNLKDKIVMTGISIEQYETVICNNIFEFVRGVEVLDLNDDASYPPQYSQLYKNWGENFWRVRIEE